MPPDSASAEIRSADDTLHAIEDLVQEVARLSKAELSTREFYSELLDRAVPALAAAGGAVWIRGARGQLHLECRVNGGPALLLGEDSRDRQRHADLLEFVVQSGEPRAVAPDTEVSEEGPAANPTEFLLLLCPLTVEQATVGVMEIFQRPGTSPAAQQGYLRFLAALCELAADFHRNLQLRELRDRAALWEQFEQFTERVHAHLDLRETAYVVANEGRRLIECDRLSIGILRGSKFRILAISGLDSIDRRSNLVARLERLAAAVALGGEPLWYADLPLQMPPQIETALHACLEESQARLLAVIPLLESDAAPQAARRPRAIGAMIIERFEAARTDAPLRNRVDSVSRHAELALRNALAHRNLPLYPVVRALQQAGWVTRGRQLPKTLLAVIATVAIVTALALIPAEFEIEGRGELQPQTRRDVFAGSEGVVSEVRVDHASRVAPGDLLVVLRKSQLDFEFSRVLGEMQTSRKRLSGVQASRLATTAEGADARNRYNQLTGEEEELKELLLSLEKQYEILKAQQDDLNVRSPISGQVLTWNVAQLLAARPVQRGQSLLTVADLSGPWVLEMQVPDERIGHVLEAQRGLGSNLAVSFVLATDPAVTHRGTIDKVALSVETDEKHGPETLVTVRVNRDEIPGLRPGQTVVPKIHCGPRSLGYVWLHTLWETIQKRLLF